MVALLWNLYFGYVHLDQAMPNLTFRAEMSQFSAIRTAMKVEEHVHAASVIRKVETVEEADNMFDPITYNKGNVKKFQFILKCYKK